MDGSRNPTVFAASFYAIANSSVGCSPGTRAARVVTYGGPGAAALKYLDEDGEAEDPAPTTEGDDGEDNSSEDEKPAPEDGGDEHQAKRKACFARLGALVGTQIQVCMFSLPNPPQGGLDPSNLQWQPCHVHQVLESTAWHKISIVASTWALLIPA
jgi:hypothetical protein